jgi:hypothetical protein
MGIKELEEGEEAKEKTLHVQLCLSDYLVLYFLLCGERFMPCDW